MEFSRIFGKFGNMLIAHAHNHGKYWVRFEKLSLTFTFFLFFGCAFQRWSNHLLIYLISSFGPSWKDRMRKWFSNSSHPNNLYLSKWSVSCGWIKSYIFILSLFKKKQYVLNPRPLQDFSYWTIMYAMLAGQF